MLRKIFEDTIKEKLLNDCIDEDIMNDAELQSIISYHLVLVEEYFKDSVTEIVFQADEIYNRNYMIGG